MKEKLLRHYLRIILENSTIPEVSSLAILVNRRSDEIEVILFRYDDLYSAMSKRNFDEEISNFLENDVFNSIIGYGVFTKPEKGEAYGAYEVTHAAAPGFGKVLYGIGYALSPTGFLMPDRDKNAVSPDADQAWRKASVSRKSLKLDSFPPNNKTKSMEDDAVLHNVPGKEHLDYVYEEQGWEKSMTNKLILKGEAVVKELSNDIDKNMIAVRNAFTLGGRKFFANQYASMLQRTRR